ncbi:hypothetical protein SARC_14704 [Sphaeroforma arctica JP610]|uniref:Homing endonuclease LAGLIDADG domain-containing protein n=1 Tax=Sphaeroforma arctica JP610 TaxID=667725 RepID=A0A0L0F863_9EUKA|nr:hypothetical protein SARC_14704 [Sphaeroforma arctica JP610]KNC72736.1 hypothetical protein SARC_14704 [Sphaeroforma arctica JP610]|eukprot:XP_014146638.1 hypothetical protein SARC_14704 [Sphaeroforma arctica JP610]
MDKFNDYLTGLIEADGSIVCPKKDRFPSGKLTYPSIELCFHSKDFPWWPKSNKL